MKLEKTVLVRTPDGVDHPNVEAAINPPKDEPMDERVFHLREAIRDVFLATWPRASKGKPREKSAPAGDPPAQEPAPAGEGESAPTQETQSEPEPQPETEPQPEPTDEPAPAANNRRKR